MNGKDRKNAEPAAVADNVQLVTFKVGLEEYALDINAITEVIRPLKVTPLPKMPRFIEGVINLRGTIIPVVDLRIRFELSVSGTETKKMRMIITRGAIQTASRHSGDLLGLLVDRVDEVIHIPKKDIDPPPEAATGRSADFITGMGKVGERLIILLEIGKILSQQERKALTEAGNG